MQMAIGFVKDGGAKAGKIITKITSVTNLMSGHGVCARRCGKICKEGKESHLKHQNISEK
jgi:hypothetical protein